MEYASLYDPETIEHLRRHFQGSQTVGSKFTLDPAAGEKLLADVEEQLATRFGELSEDGKTPGRLEFQIHANAPVGKQALISLAGRENDAFEIIRDKGKPSESKVKVVLASPNDIPSTHDITVIAKPYGPTGKWGIITMFPGSDAAQPFPNDGQTAEVKASNKAYWQTHGFLATPAEIKALIDVERSHLSDLNAENDSQVMRHFGKTGDTGNHYPDWLREANSAYHEFTKPLQGQLDKFATQPGREEPALAHAG